MAPTFSDELLRWWVPHEALTERERFSCLANYSLGGLARGGKLIATDEALVFVPNRVDARLGTKRWQVPWIEVSTVDRKARTWGLFDGGLRTRLRIVLLDESEHLFVVNRLNAAVSALSALHAEAKRRVGRESGAGPSA